MGRPKFTPKTALPFDDHHLHLIHPSLDRPHSPFQTASGSNQPFCHSTLSGQTDWQTERWSGRPARIMSALLTMLIESDVLTTTTVLRPLSRLSRYQKKHSPTHTYADHKLSFISFFHLLWSTGETNSCIFACRLSGFMVQGNDNKGRYTDSPAGCHPLQTNWCPLLHHPHHFYAWCLSCCNPPNLSWLGTGTKYSGLHTWRLGWYHCLPIWIYHW